MKNFSISLVALSLISSGLLAQASDSAASAPTISDIKFDGEIQTGIRSELSGLVKGGDEANLVGPYVLPSFSLNYKNSDISILAGYQFEAFGGQGFGEGFGEGTSKSFQDNTYFAHLPFLGITGNLNENWTLGAYTEYMNVYYAGNDAQNKSELVIEPNLTRKFGERYSVGISYQYYRAENFDKAGTSLGSLDLTGGRAAVNESIAKNLINPVSQRHVAKLIGTAKVTDNVSLAGYVHAGRRYFNQGEDANVYRFNTDISTKPVKTLSLKLRYRIDMTDFDSWYNLVGIYGTYNITDSLGVTLTNEAVLTQTRNAASKYSNENYLGLSYSF